MEYALHIIYSFAIRFLGLYLYVVIWTDKRKTQTLLQKTFIVRMFIDIHKIDTSISEKYIRMVQRPLKTAAMFSTMCTELQDWNILWIYQAVFNFKAGV